MTVLEGALSGAEDDRLRWHLLAATLAAFVGTYFGKKVFEKVTLDSVHRVVATMLVLLAIGMALGAV